MGARPLVVVRCWLAAVARLATAALCTAICLTATAAQARAALAPLTTKGNQIIRAGTPFDFYGVNRDSLEWGYYNWGGCGGDGHFAATDWNAIAAWKASAVRIPLSEADWLGRRCNAGSYAADVDAAIQNANSRGMYAILDLHWSDIAGRAPCDAGCPSGQQPMPDSDSVTFWKQVATRYASWAGVIFDLYNEPHGVSWSCWRSGGCTVISSTANPQTGLPVSYTATGMQQLLNAVRETGARNLVLAAGLNWAYDLSGVGQGYALHGSNLAYDTHVYVQWHNTNADWNAAFGYLTASYPVTASEFGSIDCSTSVTYPLLQYFYAPNGVSADRMSWTIWSWNAPGSCSQPSVLANWSGTALNGQGQLIQQALSYLAP